MLVPVLWLLGHRVVQEHEALQPGAEEQEADRVVVVDEVAAKKNRSSSYRVTCQVLEFMTY